MELSPLTFAARMHKALTENMLRVLRVWDKGWRWLRVHTFQPAWLPGRWRHPVTGYLIACALASLAVLLTWLVTQRFSNFMFMGSLSFLVVIFVAFTFGAGPSLLATFVGVALLWYLVIPPQLSFDITQEPEALIGLSVHMIVGVSVAILASRVEQSRQQATDERTVARQMNARLQTTLDVLPVGVGIADASGRLALKNRAFQTLWGVSDLSTPPGDQSGACLGWRPDGSPIAAHEWGLVRAMRDGVSVLNEEIEIGAITGERRSVLYSAAPIHSTLGVVDGGVVVMLDITERRKLERRTHIALTTLLAMAETLVAPPQHPAAIPVASIEPWERTRERSAIQQVLTLTQHLFGGQFASALLITEDSEVIEPIAVVGLAPADEQRWWKEMSHARLGDFALSLDKSRLYAEELSVLYIESKLHSNPGQGSLKSRGGLLAALRLDAGRMCLVKMEVAERGELTPQDFELAVATARLVGSLVEQERLLREREEARAMVLALEEINRRMDEFLGIVSHELRTPLTSAKLSAQMADRWLHQWFASPDGDAAGVIHPDRTTKLLALIAQINRQIARQERLVSDLLDASRIHAGRLELHMVPIDLVAVARDVVDEQRLLHPGRVITLDVKTGEEPVMIKGDADRIGQAIANYLTNALKYSPEYAAVRVSLDLEGHMACLRVQDAGPGVPAEEQERLWERFYRAPDVVVQSGSGVGLGLGLYITRTIVERHSGQVGLTSAPGAGSTFWLTLPLIQA